MFMLEPTFMDSVDSPKSLELTCDDLPEQPASPGRTWSYCRAVDKEKESVFMLPREEVRAGLQANLRLFLLHSAEVFLVPEDFEVLAKQVYKISIIGS